MKYQMSFRPKSYILTCENNMLSSHVKISPLLWLHNKSRLLHQKNYLSEMVWYFIGVYIINRTLHGRCAHSWNIFQHSKRNFISQRGQVISSIFLRLTCLTCLTCIFNQTWLDHLLLMTSYLVTIVTDHHLTCVRRLNIFCRLQYLHKGFQTMLQGVLLYKHHHLI